MRVVMFIFFGVIYDDGFYGVYVCVLGNYILFDEDLVFFYWSLFGLEYLLVLFKV